MRKALLRLSLRRPFGAKRRLAGEIRAPARLPVLPGLCHDSAPGVIPKFCLDLFRDIPCVRRHWGGDWASKRRM